jgi:predicted RNase H-like HicB family nuclease
MLHGVAELPMLKIETEREDDGRWIAEVPALPGVLVYGTTQAEAHAKVQALALRVIADRLENGEPLPREIAGVFEAA